ncbi:mediator of RNA polymerase II transcription subunit 18-like protein [Euroglyphus maynei]|uniref:Mediator of RNA polymerase II transcription subunit 18 n=1 Tax=Euroglyphus maynei TaxID=6958 RepID=A0A1Y3AVE1_EURMA|nr:mediator of RNA polymerase II transcription subunit 18-like protein [Euroglyphus maynei]
MTESNFQQRKNTFSQNEFLLQGSILDESCDALLQKLRGFCDNSDMPPPKFKDHEMVFAIKLPNGPSSTLRVRRSMDCPTNPWNLRYLGHNDTDRNRATLSRTCIDCNTTSNITQFLAEMGFKLEFEFILRGWMFRKGRMKILVFKIFRINGGSGVMANINTPNMAIEESLEPITNSHLVELSVIAPSYQTAMTDEMKQFAEFLKPLVMLENIDMRKINQ